MKKKINSLIVLGVLTLSALVPGIEGHAAAAKPTPPAVTDPGVKDGDTQLTAKFVENSQVVTPVQPDDPKTPVASDAAQYPGVHGGTNSISKAGSGLTLVYITNKLDFGTHEIDPLKEIVTTANYKDSKNSSNNADISNLWSDRAVIEVGDVRGTNSGWTLSVSSGSLKSSNGDVIDGATLAFPTGTVNNAGKKNNAKPYQLPKIDCQDDTAGGTILDAAAGEGFGITVDKIDPGQIALTIPANTAKAEAYSGNLHWSLDAVPRS